MSLHADRVGLATVAEVNPYLLGAFAPTQEELTLTDLEVVGEIPEDLNGVYVRNGPNPQFEPNGRYHWFDGDGMVHAVHIERREAPPIATAGSAPAAFAASATRAGRCGAGSWSRGRTTRPGDAEKDTANTDVVFHNERLLALWYRAGKPYALDPAHARDLGAEDFGGTLRCEVSAHAKVDERRASCSSSTTALKPPYMRYGVVSPDGAVAPLRRHRPARPAPAARHGDHRALLDPDGPPADQRPRGAAAVGRYKLFFERDMPSRFGVIPRYGDADEVRWFEAEPCFIYHSVNAWEEGDEIVMDVCRVKRPEPRSDLDGPLAQMLATCASTPTCIATASTCATGRTNEQVVDDDNSEFPSINQGLVGRALALCLQHAHLAGERRCCSTGS